ncbi:MAG: phosphate signaling complex protein PhoU [Lachnospiraceae bacterium]|nr:phosphate signaling complex protein PhoU [Lachnospiraceae bacterium]
MTPRKIYDQELALLRDSLEDMANMVEASLNNLFFAIENKDNELAKQIIKDDHNINNMERSIESQCLSLITKQQPIAGDLRIVSSILKVVTDVERIGDHASDIAELILRLNNAQLETYSAHLQPMITATKEMVHDAVSAFINRDRDHSAEVIESDDVVDELFNKVKTDIANRLRTENGDVDECIDVLMIAKYLERIGDHAVNICEWEIFKETGSIENTLVY